MLCKITWIVSSKQQAVREKGLTGPFSGSVAMIRITYRRQVFSFLTEEPSLKQLITMEGCLGMGINVVNDQSHTKSSFSDAVVAKTGEVDSNEVERRLRLFWIRSIEVSQSRGIRRTCSGNP